MHRIGLSNFYENAMHDFKIFLVPKETSLKCTSHKFVEVHLYNSIKSYMQFFVLINLNVKSPLKSRNSECPNPSQNGKAHSASLRPWL